MTQQKLRLGEHYSAIRLDRRIGSLRILEFEHLPGATIPEHRHERAHLIVLLEGAYLEHERGDATERMTGDAALYPRGATHSNTIGNKGARTLAIEFEADDLPRLVPGAFSRIGRTLHLKNAPGATLAAAARGPATQLEQCVRELLARMVGEADREPDWITAIRAELDRDGAPDPNIAELAKAAGRHPAHVMREFRRHAGVPIGEYARARRIARACEALHDLETPISDIAIAHGFADQSHLARTFKRFMNMTPDEYRRTRRS